MTVEDAMTPDVVTVTPQTTILSAAAEMKRQDIGMLPVTESDRIVGVLTDRDIVLRGCAEGMDPRSTRVEEIMTRRVIECLGTQTLQEAGDLMEKHQVRRIIVTNADKKVLGVLSVDDLAKKVRNPILTNEVFREVSTVRPDKA